MCQGNVPISNSFSQVFLMWHGFLSLLLFGLRRQVLISLSVRGSRTLYDFCLPVRLGLSGTRLHKGCRGGMLPFLCIMVDFPCLWRHRPTSVPRLGSSNGPIDCPTDLGPFVFGAAHWASSMREKSIYSYLTNSQWKFLLAFVFVFSLIATIWFPPFLERVILSLPVFFTCQAYDIQPTTSLLGMFPS